MFSGYPVGAINDDAYRIVLILHILCAIIGFGAVFLNGLYGAQAKARRGAEGLAILEANVKVSKIGEYFIYAVFLLGIALVQMSDSVFKFSQDWLWISVAIYVIALGISHGLLFPRVKKIIALMREMVDAGPPGAGAPGGPPPQAAQLEVLGKQVAVCGATLNVMLIVIVFLMVWKPGGVLV
jgi:hypothetical protein